MDISRQKDQKMQNNKDERPKSAHKVELDHFHTMSVTGIVDVPTFTDKLVEVVLPNERLQIIGSGMSIKTIDIEGGRLQLNGQVNSIKYTTSSTPTSFVKRIFK